MSITSVFFPNNHQLTDFLLRSAQLELLRRRSADQISVWETTSIPIVAVLRARCRATSAKGKILA